MIGKLSKSTSTSRDAAKGRSADRDVADLTPWSTGLLVAALCASLGAIAVFAFGAAMLEVHPVLAVVVNVVVVSGAAPTVWRWRRVPVLRWVVYGLAPAILFGWFALLLA